MMHKSTSNQIVKGIKIVVIIGFVLFLLFDLFIRPPKPQVGMISLVDSVFILMIGIMILGFTTIVTINAWKLSSKAYDQWLLSISLWGKSARRGFAGKLSPTYRQWQDRLLSLLGLLFGLFVCAIGIINLWKNIQTCMMQACIW